MDLRQLREVGVTASPDGESLLWEARGYLGLDDDEAVPREELIEQAVANGYQEREVQQAIRNADVLELAGDLDDPRVQLAADAEHDERHHSADDTPNGDLQTAEEDLDGVVVDDFLGPSQRRSRFTELAGHDRRQP